MSKSQEIQGTSKEALIGWLIALISKCFGLTYRVTVVDNAGVTEKFRKDPVVFVVWHNRIFSSLILWKKTSSHFPTVALMSASKDGAILEKAVNFYGAGSVRGSSSRRGVAALIALRKEVRNKKDAYITPDGPRGPKYKLQPGALKLAQSEQVPIIVKQIKLHSFWEISKTWDGLRIPKPFSKIELVFEKPIMLPRNTSDEEFEAHRLRIENLMNKSN